MTHREQKTRESLRHWRNFATGLLIGTAVQTPVFAATGNLIPDQWSATLVHGDWTTLLLVASVVLLGVGLLLRIRAHDRTPRAPVDPDPQDSIGRYRPQVYRP
jgi:hypothetical protein